ncbi:glycosyltransferase family 4 protein [Hymenobacter sp. BT683]|uniref:Glycosyltransferase family 4 protein n=1 Tax=Hymenobacter jeongseonensis TaxID=2791027 RepID=A0ABS0ID31_9BACT|nr:glycosyltransferase family 4 protein [Hymenobacter jeongseonensis]MBF9236259.1 glycosyltransferase family 4 protein [Hymenobacter jeongseonensis]
MNILLTSFLHPDAPSGVRVHYLQLAAQLRLQGHLVDVVTPATLTGGRRHLLAALRHVLLRLGPRAQALAGNISCFLLVCWGINRRRAYDVVNAQDVGSGVAAQWVLGPRVPVVVTGHFNEHPATEQLRQQPCAGRAARGVRRWYDALLARTQYFISVSVFGLRLIRPFLPASAECRVVHNGLDLDALRARPARVDLRSRFPHQQIILNIGQLESRKNQGLLVDAARELRQVRTDFVIGLVGKGEDEDLLLQRIAAYGLQAHVVLLGYHHDVMPWLRCADLYVHVASHETFGLVLLEAAAAGVPALALAVGGVPEVLHATPCALLPPATDAAGLAGQLHHWLNAPALRQNLADRQAASATAHFGVARMVSETLAFYRHAIWHHRLQLLAVGHPSGCPAAPSPAALSGS